jgi:hypothetical protein
MAAVGLFEIFYPAMCSLILRFNFPTPNGDGIMYFLVQNARRKAISIRKISQNLEIVSLI